MILVVVGDVDLLVFDFVGVVIGYNNMLVVVIIGGMLVGMVENIVIVFFIGFVMVDDFNFLEDVIVV